MGRRYPSRPGDRTTRALTHLALDMKEQAFRQRFAGADNDKLLNYMAHCARELGIGPDYNDVLGAAVLKERFGDWDRLLFKIGLTMTPHGERKHVPSLFARELPVQEEMHQQILAAMVQNEQDFAVQHAGDSDEKLFEYVRGWSKRLKYSPRHEEVLGGEYIRKRFNNDWQKVLHLAGFKPPTKKLPKLHQQLIYLDEARRQLEPYVEECMQEIAVVMAGKKVIYVAPAEKAV